MTPAKIGLSERSKTSTLLSSTGTHARAPLALPMSICNVPAEIVVRPV